MNSVKRTILISVFIIFLMPNYCLAQRSGQVEGHEADIKAATEAALKWLELIDSAAYAESWDQASAFFKANTPKEKWVETLEGLMPQFGENNKREADGSRYLTKIPGGPDGEYVMLRFNSSFENKEEAVETVTPAKDGETWRVSGYYIR